MDAVCLEPMVLVVYVSSSKEALRQEEVLEILRVSRRNNERAGVTGMLLYKDGNFIQVLEGPEPAVEQTLARIRGDERHCGVLELLRRGTTERQFPNWSMGFRNVAELSGEDAKAFSPFLASTLEQKNGAAQGSGVAYTLLKQFAKNVR